MKKMNNAIIDESSESTEFNTSTYIKKNAGSYIIYIFFNFIFLILSLVIPYYLSLCVDEILKQEGWNTVIAMLGKFFVLAVVECVVFLLISEWNIKLSNIVAFQIEFDTLRYIKFVKYKALRKFDNVYLTQRINNDAVMIGDYLVEKIPVFVKNIVLILFLVPIMFYMYVPMGIFLVIFIVVFYGVYFGTKNILYKRNHEMLEAQSKFFSMIDNQIFNMLVIKINAWYKEKDKEFVSAVNNFFEKSMKYLRIDFSLTAFNEFLSRIAYAGSILILGWAVAHGSVSVGILTTVFMYIEMILSKIKDLTEIGKYRESYRVAVNRMENIFQLEQEENGEELLTKIDTISVNQLAVRDDKNFIFKGKDVELKKGNIYLLYGENGTGKSTFIETLTGVLEAAEGNILYNGVDISKLNMYEIRRKLVAITEQEPMLQDGTIRENLLYGLNREKEEIEDETGLLEFVKRKPEGMNTYVSNRNTNLSGGEKQKIAVCRSMLKGADILILDEPTSAMDDISVKRIVEKLKSFKEDHIIIVISHDSRLKDIADDIIHFK
ncbi:ATP-binding cassette domain-containing protein [Roseburia sp. 499]|uniref:ATP-binding cassette domain-containing protein n=1 Tax=Roseburia sp. 499 TaxID=1261634 RepID=UPI000951E651|nr:ABC transporter ATP-binding protein [Roseburia sp. 499]WVK71508.1 ABC transporter ATP-binding protein [Roseburia sp. 499]